MAAAEPPRKRLRCKSPAPTAAAARSVTTLALPLRQSATGTGSPCSSAASSASDGGCPRHAKKALWHLRVRNVLRKDVSTAPWDVKRARARAKVAGMKGSLMSKQEIEQISTHYKDAVTKTPGVEFLLRNYGDACVAKFKRRDIKAYNALVTWSGSWGLIP